MLKIAIVNFPQPIGQHPAIILNNRYGKKQVLKITTKSNMLFVNNGLAFPLNSFNKTKGYVVLNSIYTITDKMVVGIKGELFAYQARKILDRFADLDRKNKVEKINFSL